MLVAGNEKCILPNENMLVELPEISMTKIDGLTFEEIHKLYRVAARVVAMYGDAYLPVFSRLHTEVEKINTLENIKSVALEMAFGKNSRKSRDIPPGK